MKFPTKEKLQAAWNTLLTTLGLVDKVKNKEMTQEDWANFGAAFEKKHGISIQTAIEEVKGENGGSSKTPELSDDEKNQIIGAITEACEKAGVETPTLDMSSIGTAFNGILVTMQTMAKNMKIMGQRQEPPTPIAVVGASMDASVYARVLGHTAHTPTHLFGIEEDYYKRGAWWTDLVVNGKGKDDYRDEDALEFRAAFNNFAKDFAARCYELIETNQIGLLDYDKMIKGESFVDYSQMNSKLGEFTVRRFDMIIAYFRSLKSVANIFPVVPDVQNEMKAPTAFFGELSQSYLSGHHYKGGVHFDGEKYHVDDCMMKFAFMDPKELEKAFIGYKNRDAGSNPMKWDLFGWIIQYFGKILFNEQQRRRVVGVFTPRQGEFPQPAMLAADGVLRAIQRVEEEYKVLPFKDLEVYDETTILEYVRTFWAKVSAILPNMEGMKLYANEKHQLWYIDAYDAKYKNSNDYTGPKNDIRYYSPENIVWVPNLDINDQKMWITVPGNVENYEFKANEMYAFYFQQDLEILIMASWWKEGSGVLAPGVPFPTEKALEDSERIFQFLFTNYPVTKLDPGATVINGKLNREYQTVANAAATEITDIQNASREKVYKIICGDLTNKSIIKKAGKFNIDSDWTPNAVGDYLKVYPEFHEVTKTVGKKTIKVVEPTGNFLELERKVSN